MISSMMPDRPVKCGLVQRWMSQCLFPTEKNIFQPEHIVNWLLKLKIQTLLTIRFVVDSTRKSEGLEALVVIVDVTSIPKST